MPARTPGARPVAIAWPATPRELIEIWSRDLGRATPFVEEAGQALVVSGSQRSEPAPGRAAASDRRAARRQWIRCRRCSIRSAAPSAQAASCRSRRAAASSKATRRARRPRRLAPGDAVGVSLLTGDFELGATGTVTHVDGDRVYAFGHPLYNLGPTEFPMTSANVVAVLPSLLQSSKLASFGEVIGTLQQDRATAVAGRLGAGPSLIPMTITLNSDRGPSRNFSFGIVRDFTFTPLLSYLAVANVLTSYERGRRSGLVRDQGHGDDRIRRRHLVRRHLHRRSAGRRRRRLRRGAAHGAAQERVRCGQRRAHQPDDRRHRAVANGAHRAGLARHDSPEGRRRGERVDRAPQRPAANRSSSSCRSRCRRTSRARFS